METLALAWFVAQTPETCTWQGGRMGAVTGVTATSVIARFPTPCPHAPRVALHPAGRTAVVEIGDVSYRVDLATGTSDVLPPPPAMQTWTLGFDATGTITAYGVQYDLLMDPAARQAIEGAAALPPVAGLDHDVAVQQVWHDGWTTARRELTSTGYCGASGLSVLPPLATPASWAPPQATWGAPDAATTTALDAFRPPARDMPGEWRTLSGPSGTVAQYFEVGDADYPQRPVLLERAKGWLPIDPALVPVGRSRDIRVDLLGPYALLSTNGANPVLVELGSGRVRALPAGALAVTADPRGRRAVHD